MKYDARNFNFAIEEIARKANVPVQRVVDFEAGKVLEAAIKETYSATSASIRNSFASTRNAKKKKALPAALRARGLAKQAWLYLARAAALTVRAPAFVQKAAPSDGRTYDNASVTRRTGNKANIYFTTDQPTLSVPSVRGRRIIYRALGRRERFFRINLEKGVFAQLATVAKKYPGLSAA